MEKSKIESIEEEFDKKFPPDFKRIDGKDYIEISSFATTPESIKSFYRQKISKLVRECVGKNKELFLGGKSVDHCDLSYNQAKVEIRTAFKKAGIEL